MIGMRRFSSIAAVRGGLRQFASKASAFEPGKVSSAPVEYTHKLHFSGEPKSVLPSYQVMDMKGGIGKNSTVPEVSDEELLKMYRVMVELYNTDQVLYDLQRQGAISFYMTAYGEYASHVGSAAALSDKDMVFAQYREAGVLMYRGFTVEDICHQCYSNAHDVGKGRQMPVHYGSRALNFQTISSPLSTQIPQAAGAAYAMKRRGEDAISMCYFGEGAASEGDFHAALNMASTLDCPVVFFCRNNRFAISTPVIDQFRGDGIASRGAGYGIETVRVDGNDALAVLEVTREARRRAVETSRPMLIEAMTYRIGHHSTSDDSSRYRPNSEIDDWNATNNPITRLRGFIESRGLWDAERDAQLNTEARDAVLGAFRAAEHVPKPPIDELFNDVYDTLPKHLLEQRDQLRAHLEEYAEHYQTDHFMSSDEYANRPDPR